MRPALQQLMPFPTAFLHFERSVGRRYLRRLATAPAATAAVRTHGVWRGLCLRCVSEGQRFEGRRRFWFDGRREDFSAFFDEPLEDQPDGGPSVRRLSV